MKKLILLLAVTLISCSKPTEAEITSTRWLQTQITTNGVITQRWMDTGYSEIIPYIANDCGTYKPYENGNTFVNGVYTEYKWKIKCIE